MSEINKNPAPTHSAISTFIESISFPLPNGFIDFYKQSNGCDITSDKEYTILWPLTELMEANEEYDVAEYAPEFFLFGSDGGGTAFAIEKSTGHIFAMPFIGMCKEEAIFVATTFDGFMQER